MWISLYPIPLLVLSCLGLGGLLLQVGRGALPQFPPWLHAAVAYFLGQGVLAAVLMVLALIGLFSPAMLLVVMLPSAVSLTWLLWRSRSEWAACLSHAATRFRAAPVSWRVLAAMAAGLYLYGFGTLGGVPTGDAVAFYLAISKTTAYAHQLLPLPGYDAFSRSVGLFAELLVATLIGLGVPYDSARIFSWVNYLPTLILVWGLAWAVGLSGRGRLLAVCVALTSSAAILLWGDGKTDLFAVGPAFASCVLALAAWRPRTRRAATLLAGFFCGLAVVFKLSLLAVLLPTALLVLKWPALFDLTRSLRRRNGLQIANIMRQGATDLGIFGLGLAPMVLLHVAKNLWLGGAVFGFGDAATQFYTAETTRRLVLTYPFALTYGRYWAQYGNLSPLVIAFLPLLLLLPRPASWRDSHLTALTLSTLLGLVLWAVLMPAVFMPRYILSSLLMLGIPAAAGGAYFSRLGAISSAAVLLAVAVTLAYTPTHVKSWQASIDWPATKHLLADPGDECLTAAHMTNYCTAQQAINRAAVDAPAGRNRVLLFSYYRLWIRPEFLLGANTYDETLEIEQATDPWDLVRRRGFGFVFLDPGYYPQAKLLMELMPTAGGLRELYRDGALAAYEILP